MPRQLLAHYPLAPDHYDEMLAAPLTPRAHWRELFDTLVAASPEHMREQLRLVQREVRESGVSYNIHGAADASDRPWELDILPLILPADTWETIEQGVIQRATLLNAILSDIYSDQRLLTDGLLPPALVHGHAGFLRPCRHPGSQPRTLLHMYAADLARAPDGSWWVVGDRTQAPSGAGYALENRLLVSRTFPDLFRDLRVQRLASFFAQLRQSLVHWAPQDRASAYQSPLIVLLTPGPYSETYFEHAYLARYLGFPLVEGGDLTVRDGRVWLKTLSGLERVHAIVRRLDDDFCDPLELRGDSVLGVPGLVDAARRGHVLVANALGSNLLESGALLGFLPAIAERLLGEALKLPSIATWWCGESAALDQVVEGMDKLVIKPAFPQLRQEAVFGEDLSKRDRVVLEAAMRARPYNYVAQEFVRLSRAPVWDKSAPRRLLARSIGLRVYACATPDGYIVMPGGLTRTASGPDARVVSLQRGGGSKDTWVLARGPVGSFSLLRQAVGPQDLVRTGINLSSRVTEHLFWFGRYCARADNLARLLRLTIARLIDDVPDETDLAWPAILTLCRQHGLLEKPPAVKVGDDQRVPTSADIEAGLMTALEGESLSGLADCLRRLSGVAVQLRDRMSLDNWRSINQLVTRPHASKSARIGLPDVIAWVDGTITAMMTLAGFTLDGMTRDHGWRFLSLGRRIERLQFVSSALLEALRGPANADLDWLLELYDSTITYRSRYRDRPEWLPALDLLIRDPANPRSIEFQLHGVHDYLERLEELYGPCGAELLVPLIESVKRLDPGSDLRHGATSLLALTQGLLSAGGELSDFLNLRFFSHAGAVNRQTFAS
jgi:uncharacterized circularly permuted ATP-grasp superfamily protein/uncharacterized alpha-E superfamily protein